MKRVLALVLAGGRVDELSVLTLSRPKSALPFGGMYRVIDFCLSNLMHSGVENVGILSQYRSFSLINHVGIGSWWDFVGRDRGATLLLPSQHHKGSDWYNGTADAVFQNLEFIHEQHPETVLILSGDHVYKMNYLPMLDYHRKKDADLTICFASIDAQQGQRFGVAEIDDEDGATGGRMVDYLEKPARSSHRWASLTIFLFKPDVLYKVLTERSLGGGTREFGRDVLPAMLGKYKIYGYKFDGYWGYTRTLDEYWQTNMDLLGEEPKIPLQEWQVRTNLDHDRLRDRPPAKIGGNARIANSCFYNGCEIEGEVQNSILFPGVKVRKGASVRDSILFFDTVIEEGVSIDRTIADFDVRVENGAQVGVGDSVANREYPNLLHSGLTLIGKGAQLPAGLELGKNCIVAPELKATHFKRNHYESGTTIT